MSPVRFPFDDLPARPRHVLRVEREKETTMTTSGRYPGAPQPVPRHLVVRLVVVIIAAEAAVMALVAWAVLTLTGGLA